MTAKKYLQTIKRYDDSIAHEIEILNDMRRKVSLISGIDYAKDRVQSSPASGNVQIEAIVDMENNIIRMIEEQTRIKLKIIDEIQTLSNPMYVEILIRRYVELKSFEEISCNMNYSYYYTIHLHGEALNALDKMLKEKDNESVNRNAS